LLHLPAGRFDAREAARWILEFERTSITIGVRRDVTARQHGPEAVFEIGSHERQNAHGFAVKSAAKADELIFSGISLGKPKSRLHRFGSA
jgi:hypothetical protein